MQKIRTTASMCQYTIMLLFLRILKTYYEHKCALKKWDFTETRNEHIALEKIDDLLIRLKENRGADHVH